MVLYPWNTRDTVVRLHGMPRCAKYQYRTRTCGTRDPITAGIPIPVPNPTHPWFGAAMRAIHVLALSLALHLQTSSAFSFTINNTPEQCSDLNISITGLGQSPYSAVIVPYITAPSSNKSCTITDLW